MNITSDTQATSTAVVVLRTVFIALNALAIIFANTLNIIILGRAQVGSEPARVLISSLALADIVVGAVAFVSTVPSGHDGFPFSDELCQVAGSIFAVGLLLSIFFLAAISVDRFIAVTMALRYERLITRKRAIIMVILAWIIMSGLMLLVILLRPDILNYNHATFFCEPSLEDPNFPLLLFITIMIWIMNCSLIMAVTYGHLFQVAHRHSRRIAVQELAVAAAVAHTRAADRPRWSVVARKDMKAVRMCLAVTMAFNVAWVPTLCLDFYKFIAKSNAAPGAEFAITWLSLSNSWWNFLIYSGMNKQFRDATKQLFKQVWNKCRRRTVQRQPRELNLSVQGSRHDEQSGHVGDPEGA